MSDDSKSIDRVDAFGCRGNTIKVASGHYIDLLNPDPRSIDIRSIASALSKICRFGGHCPKFYSVAEHCFLAAELAHDHGCDDAQVLAVLLHDATEAYLGDMVKPLKQAIPMYREIEARMAIAIETRFGISFEKHERIIKRFDRAMLKAEKVKFWPADREEWQGLSDVETPNIQIKCFSPKLAEEWFGQSFIERTSLNDWFAGE